MLLDGGKNLVDFVISASDVVLTYRADQQGPTRAEIKNRQSRANILLFANSYLS